MGDCLNRLEVVVCEAPAEFEAWSCGILIREAQNPRHQLTLLK